MKRRKFIKACSAAALGVGGLSLLNACKQNSVYKDYSTNERNEIIVLKSEFSTEKPYVFINHPAIENPICLFKIADDNYAASLMSCTHQHCQTTVKKDYYICPCHGARFSNTGKVLKGPADKDLTSYQLRIDDSAVFISL